jgi:DNA-binding CsgD family transcriptional regulator
MVNLITISVLIYGSDLKRSAELSQLLAEEPAIRIVGCYDVVDQFSHHEQIHEATIILVDTIHLMEVSEIIQALSLSKTIVFTVSGVLNIVESIKNNRFNAKLLLEPTLIGSTVESPQLSANGTHVLKERKIISEQLTEREREVLDYLVKGCSYKMIAYSMFISLDTVRSHIKKIYTKLEVNSKSEAVIKVLSALKTN